MLVSQNTPKLFVIEFDLYEFSGHFFNQVLGFKCAAEEIGMIPHVLVSIDTPDSIASKLNAKQIINLKQSTAKNASLDYFIETHLHLLTLWSYIEELAVSKHDFIIITSSRPNVIYSLSQWLSTLNKENVPFVFIRFFGHEYFDLKTMNYNNHSWVYRFAARDIGLRQGQEKIFFTTNNKTTMPLVSDLCSRRFFHMPLPKYYGNTHHEIKKESLVIYVHLNVRSQPLLPILGKSIHKILKLRPNITFIIKSCANLQLADNYFSNKKLPQKSVTILPTEQSPEDYLQNIIQSDIVLQLYRSNEYKFLASGVFCEAVSFGKISVVPEATWMADQINEGKAVGSIYQSNGRKTKIVPVLLSVIDNIKTLKINAENQAQVFRQENSCKRNLELMINLASQKIDMRPTYTLNHPIKFSSQTSRNYLTEGWSGAESKGVWSDGYKAKLFFLLENKPENDLKVSFNLTPFSRKGHSQEIIVSTNGTMLTNWNLGDKKRILQELVIPAIYIEENCELNLTFEFKKPISPQQLNLSPDTRLLGFMLHELTIASLT